MTRLPAALLAPVILPQARLLRRRTPRLADAFPPGVTQLGSGAAEVLVVGDSTAVGTGIDEVTETIGLQFAAALGCQSVIVAGRSGATSDEVRLELLRDRPVEKAAWAALVLVGWNDAMRLRSASRFAHDLDLLLDEVKRIAPAARIVVAAPPRFGRYRALPQPLRLALGAQARGLERAAERLVRTRVTTMVDGLDGSSTVSDGFHPDSVASRALALRAAAALRRPTGGR